MYAYHIDRSFQLKANQILKLIPLNDFLPNYFLDLELLEFFNPLKEGLSFHGDQYLRKDFFTYDRFNTLADHNLEFIYELIRQAHFPNKLSRLQSVFAVKDMSEFRKWDCLLSSNSNYQIARLEFDAKNCLEFDATFLRSDMCAKDNGYIYSPLTYYKLAFKYWQSSSNPNKTQPELIIRPPIKVIEIIPNL